MSPYRTETATNGAGRRPVLSVRGLHTAVSTPEGSFDVVRDVSFDINPNEVLCLVGESGCGKTITALSIMRLLPTPPVQITSARSSSTTATSPSCPSAVCAPSARSASR